MLKRATAPQTASFERLKVFFGGTEVKFTLIGAAACREYGLSRSTVDLDIVVFPYAVAIGILLKSGDFKEDTQDADWTRRTCTLEDTKTCVPLDFLTGGIRINDGASTRSSFRDRLPIPNPSGFGDIAPLPTLIAIKLLAVIGGIIGNNMHLTSGVRSVQKIKQDISDVRALITECNLKRDLKLEDEEIAGLYRKIYDGEYPLIDSLIR
jgi:hypothetical protein